MKLALDALGGDHAPEAVVDGAVSFCKAHPAHQVILVGPETRLHGLLGKESKLSNLTIRHASEVVGMDESPGAAIRSKKDSSLRICFELAKTGEADAVVSAGNSGAVMAGALLILRRLPGVERPAFAALFPSLEGSGRVLLLDAGANVECKPLHLAQFGVMGDAYMRSTGLSKPRVAVLSNGEEEGKGTNLTREAHELLSQPASGAHCVGYVEGKDLFSGKVDVIVTDGFTGNVVLKTSEGTAMAVTGMLRSAIEKSALPEKLGALLLRPTFRGLRKVVDYAEYGGAPLLGVDGVVIVAHGRSNPRAIHRALEAALENASAGLRQLVASQIARSKSAWAEKAGEDAESASVASERIN